jgi:hypothetical protein
MDNFLPGRLAPQLTQNQWTPLAKVYRAPTRHTGAKMASNATGGPAKRLTVAEAKPLLAFLKAASKKIIDNILTAVFAHRRGAMPVKYKEVIASALQLSPVQVELVCISLSSLDGIVDVLLLMCVDVYRGASWCLCMSRVRMNALVAFLSFCPLLPLVYICAPGCVLWCLFICMFIVLCVCVCVCV